MIFGINAARARSGGAKTHLTGILNECGPTRHMFAEVHIWSYPALLNALPNQPWLIKHSPPELERSMAKQLYWERFSLPKALQQAGCNVLLNLDAGTVCRFRPAVTMSRDMLSYEPGEIKRFGLSKACLRLILLRYMQNSSLQAAEGVVFLTQYAAHMIQQSCGALSRVAIIPHGVGDAFKKAHPVQSWPLNNARPIRCLYVSPVWEYKHQCVVVRAIERLRRFGYEITLDFVGTGSDLALSKLKKQIKLSDPRGIFVHVIGHVPQSELANTLANADVFVFASSCENMPNTLLEAMSVGLPIACSNRGPMPEILQDGGVYFDPEDTVSIANAIEQIITDDGLRTRVSQQARALSGLFSWQQCTDKTLAFMAETLKLDRDVSV